MSVTAKSITRTLEFSEDPLSVADASATWTDVTDYLRSVSSAYGKNTDLDISGAGDITLVLRQKGTATSSPHPRSTGSRSCLI